MLDEWLEDLDLSSILSYCTGDGKPFAEYYASTFNAKVHGIDLSSDCVNACSSHIGVYATVAGRKCFG